MAVLEGVAELMNVCPTMLDEHPIKMKMIKMIENIEKVEFFLKIFFDTVLPPEELKIDKSNYSSIKLLIKCRKLSWLTHQPFSPFFATKSNGSLCL